MNWNDPASVAGWQNAVSSGEEARINCRIDDMVRARRPIEGPGVYMLKWIGSILCCMPGGVFPSIPKAEFYRQSLQSGGHATVLVKRWP